MMTIRIKPLRRSRKLRTARSMASNGGSPITPESLDNTASFNGYIFEFDTNNLLTVTNGSDNFAGTWSVTGEDDNDDSKSEFDDIDFNLQFINPPLFVELTEDWEVINLTDSRIELRHSSGGNGRIDLLTFERI